MSAVKLLTETTLKPWGKKRKQMTKMWPKTTNNIQNCDHIFLSEKLIDCSFWEFHRVSPPTLKT